MPRRTFRLLVFCVALALVSAACSSDDSADTTTTAAAEATDTTTTEPPTTTTTDETTTTAAEGETSTQGSDPDLYPWVSMGANADTAQVPEDFDSLVYGAYQLQAPCTDPDCGQPITPSLPTAEQATELDACDGGPVLYWQNELIVQSENPENDFSDIFVEDITPQLLLPDEEGYPPTEPQDGSDPFKLITINVTVDKALELYPDLVSPNYEYVAAPGWTFGPGDQKVGATSNADMPDELFSGGSVTVVDNFGAEEDQALDGHGEFIASLIEALTGVSPEEVPLDFDDASERFGPKWLRNDSMAVAAALRKAGTLSPEVVNLSFGTYLCTDELLVSGELAALDAEKTVVAAAGNDGFARDGPAFFPASAAIGVGAAGSTGDPADGWRVADFSNRSAVVEWAPGVAVVSKIGGVLYQWSGTSFAAPMIAAYLAASDTGE